MSLLLFAVYVYFGLLYVGVLLCLYSATSVCILSAIWQGEHNVLETSLTNCYTAGKQASKHTKQSAMSPDWSSMEHLLEIQ